MPVLFPLHLKVIRQGLKESYEIQKDFMKIRHLIEIDTDRVRVRSWEGRDPLEIPRYFRDVTE
jgi:hypothetical protein